MACINSQRKNQNQSYKPGLLNLPHRCCVRQPAPSSRVYVLCLPSQNISSSEQEEYFPLKSQNSQDKSFAQAKVTDWFIGSMTIRFPLTGLEAKQAKVLAVSSALLRSLMPGAGQAATNPPPDLEFPTAFCHTGKKGDGKQERLFCLEEDRALLFFTCNPGQKLEVSLGLL